MDKKTLEIQIKLLANQALTQVKEFSNDIKNAADKAKGFTGDAKGVATSIKTMQAEAQRTANQLKLFGLTSSDLRNTTQNLKKTILDLTDSGLKPESKEVQNLVQKYKELEEQTKKAEASEQGLFGVIEKLKNEIGSLAAVAAAVKVDKAVADLAKSSLDVNNSFQKIKDDFGIMLGDVEAGIGLFNELQEFNFWTPFDIEQTSQAAKVLVSAKVPLKDLTDYLTRFGDIAQGDAQKFQSYINAFSKASAKGKADMEVLNVYTDQGVQILDALGQQLGKSSAEIVKMASEGKISFQDLDDALNALASEGGLYYGTLEKAAMRLDAVQAGLQESVKSLKASFGQMLAPAVSAVLTVFTNLVDKINSSPILKGLLAAAIAAITVAVNALAVVAIVKLIASVKAATIAVAGLGTAINTAMPIIGAISVVVGVVTTALVANASAHQKAADAAAEHAKKMKELDNSYKDWLKTANQSEAMAAYENYSKQSASQKTTVTNLKQKLEKTPQKVWVSSASGNTSWQKDNPEYAKLKTQVKEAEDLLADYEQKRDAASRRITQAQKEDQQKLKDHAAQMIEAASKLGTEWQNKLALENAKSPIEELQFEQQQALEKLAEKASSLYDGDIEKWGAYMSEKAALNEYYNKKIAEKEKELSDKLKKEEEDRQKKLAEEAEKAKKVLQDWIDKGDPVGALERQKSEALKKNAEAAKKLYGDSYATEAAYIKANYELTKEYDEKINEARKKAASERPTVAQEAATAANSAMQGTDVGTIVDTLKSGGSIWGALISILIKAVGSLESFQKGLNLITETLKKVFTRLEPLLKNAMNIIEKILDALADALTPIFAIIIALSNEFTKLLFQGLKPIFKIIEFIGKILIDIYNAVIVPISEVITNLINAIIGFINGIFGANLDYLEAFEKIVIATDELTEEITKQQEMLKKKYQRMQDAVKEQLDSQLAALKSQYELGLISREQYEKQAEKYASEADEKIYAIEKEMNKKLEEIKNNTKDTADSTEKTSEEATSAGLKLGDMNLGLGNITEAISGINELVTSSITTMTNTITSSITSLTSSITESISSTISGVTSSITSLNSAITDSIVKIIEAITKLTTGLIPGFGGGSGGSGGLPGLPGIGVSLPGIPTISSDPVQTGVSILTGGLVDTHDSVGDNIANVLTGGLWGGIKDFFGWDVGSWSIPEDQMAMVHQGEIIIPRTFSEGIRRGELSLSSNGNNNKSESPLYVTVNVGGSVVTENQLIDSVYNGIRKGINSKRYSPLGAA
ncbi:MAG: tape measure protein [Treponema sp.]|nr:tape measure protein [Treponema sp.]